MSVFVALGSNLGDRAAMLEAAIAGLAALPGVQVLRRSSARNTPALLPPSDPTPQPDYLNAVVELESALSPRALLTELKALERRLGRATATRWAPRPIDLDLLLWNGLVLDEAELQLPHPGLATRRFVLEPLNELQPTLVHPVLKRTVAELLAAVVRETPP